MRPHLGLRTRITLVIVLITTATATVTAVAAYRLQANSTEGRFLAAALADFRSDADQARAVATRVESSDQVLRATTDYLWGRHGVDWAVFDFRSEVAPPVRGSYPVSSAARTNTRAAEPGPLSRMTDLPADLVDNGHRGALNHATVVTDQVSVLALAAPLGDDLVLVEVYDLASVRMELASLQRKLVLIALVVAAVGVLAALLAAHAVQRPVRRVTAAAGRLGQGELDVRLPVRGRDELADLARSFNVMAGRLGRSIEELTAKDLQQRRFIADVTHDLRTPVASMVAVADSLADTDPEARSRAAHLMGTQSRRLAKLVEDLLEISRFDAGAADLRPEPVDLHTLFLDAVAVTGVPVEPRTTGDPLVVADPRRLYAIARNLLANAGQHGADPVTVAIDGTGPDGVVVRVADSGPGVPEDLVPILFDRFVRGDRSRAATGGSGLGLAIARENARAHGAGLSVHNEGGAVFTLTLPRVPKSFEDNGTR
ncbi:sensor histidine kinase [Umezawaea endophytica]|uniref:histidine kinase n=1 Tax=Umezawaea endophytica TaxID=1654476 RepID=A0A9X2VGS9_9PSEU|nr:HAMP domain-containing sensor histidine kinase [Umezawaea endophytica]MCS7475869.1 HAMP domain-containing histidine kinase [Umezawaea endophytica]